MAYALIVSAAALSLAAILIAWRITAKKLDDRAEEIGRSFEGMTVLKQSREANLYGRARGGTAQLRGNGVLTLTDRELVFSMYYPKREYRIRLGSIDSIEHPKYWRGRSALREILLVSFCEEGGESDAVGILVGAPREWAEEIRRAAEKYQSRRISI